MNAVRNSVLVLAILWLASLQMSGQACGPDSKYRTSIACLPTAVANSNTQSVLAYYDGTQYVFNNSLNTVQSIAVPLGLGVQYASEIATSPSLATSSGFVLGVQNGTITTKPADLGPLISDLPRTVGSQRLYFGTSYQFMQITTTGGQNLRSFNYQNGFADGFVYGWVGLQASANLRIHSIDTYVAYGITKNLDIAVVIPWSQVKMSFHSSCPAADQISYSGGTFCYAVAQTGLPLLNGQPVYDYFFFFPGSQSVTSSGIGDVTLRGKYEFWRRNANELAFGLEYRLPTGDPLNLQGSGATGVRPFMAWSHYARFSPHVNFGYQYNGKSANDVRDNYNPSNGEYTDSHALLKSKLPNIVTGSAGLDFAWTKRFNLDADFLGRIFSNNGDSAFFASIGGFPSNLNPATNQPYYKGAYTKSTVIAGAKGKLINHLLVSASLMMDAYHGGGMSYKPSPIGTLSYDFGRGRE